MLLQHPLNVHPPLPPYESCSLMTEFYIHFQQFVLKKLLARKTIGKGVGPAQLKIMLIIIYYTLVGVMGLVSSVVSFTYYESKTNQEAIVAYLLCESSGRLDCRLEPGTLVESVGRLSVSVIVLLCFLPVVAIFITCNMQTCRKRKAKLEKRTSASVLVQSNQF